MPATEKNADIRKFLTNIDSDAIKFEQMENNSPAFPMNQKSLKRLQFASMGLNIAAIVFALLEGQWWVAIGVISFIALLEIHSRWLIARIEAEGSANWNTYQLLQNPKIDPLPSSFICRQCKYFHGRSGVVCAVHPEGCVDNKCSDFEAKY